MIALEYISVNTVWYIFPFILIVNNYIYKNPAVTSYLFSFYFHCAILILIFNTERRMAMNTKDTCLPYQSIEEHLNGCLSLVNLFLDAADNKPGAREELRPYFTLHRAREQASRACGISLPLIDMVYHFQLSGLEYFIVLLALAPELNSQYYLAYSQLQKDASFLYPTLEFANALYSFYEPAAVEDILNLTSRQNNLNILFFHTSVNPKHYCNARNWLLVLKKQALMYILGSFALDDILNGICTILPEEDSCQFICLPDIYQRLKASCQSILTEREPFTLFCLTGTAGSGRKYHLSLLKKELGLEILMIDLDKYISLPGESLEAFLEHLMSAIRILSAAVVLKTAPLETEAKQHRLSQLSDSLAQQAKVVFLLQEDCCQPSMLSGFQAIHIHYPIPMAPQRLKAWQCFKPSCPVDFSVDLPVLAANYSLTCGRIKKVWQDARLLHIYHNTKAIQTNHLMDAIAQNRTLAFGTAAVFIPARFTWNDLITAPRQRKIMELACCRMRNRHKVQNEWNIDRITPYGKGLSLLLFGPPGTGKTMAAQVISHDLGLDLYRVDLSQLFSKYIGETEKTLHLIFEEAKKADIILFFDEADAVFSKRTEISSSNDKYSNNSISYILQKIEEYDGMVILSTNYYQNIDPAFLRRITYTIRFEMPQREERLHLWRELLPQEVPVSSDIDFSLLADHFELSGSEIKSILINAVYMAANSEEEVSVKHIVNALKYEFSKTGRTITDRQIKEYGIYLPDA